MGRKLIKGKITDTKIQKKQDEISRSINISKKNKEDIEKESSDLLLGIKTKKKELNKIKEDIEKYSKKEKAVKKEYVIQKNELNCLNLTIEDLSNSEKTISKNISLLEKQYKDSKVELYNNFNNTKNILETEVLEIEEKIKKANIEIKKLIEQKKETLRSDGVLLKNIESSKIIIKNLEEEKNKLDKYIKDTNLSIKNIEDEFEILETVIDQKRQEKINTIKDLKISEEKLKDTNLDLEKAREDLKKTKELNLVLIKREDTLNARETYIKKYYKKAGLSF